MTLPENLINVALRHETLIAGLPALTAPIHIPEEVP